MVKYLNPKHLIYKGILFSFLINSIGLQPIYAQPVSPAGGDLILPAPGTMVHLSSVFNPPILKGVKVNPENSFHFEFILDKGDSNLPKQSLKDESSKLIKYFLASLTIPEKDLWVNLSPYEKDRIVPDAFGKTEMGRDLLAQDYMLKQITASLIYPEDEIGRKFWKRIYEEAAKKFGTTNIPVNTFNKVWIVPEKAVIYENLPADRQVPKAITAYVVESRLKVMLEEDYLATSKNIVGAGLAPVQNNDNVRATARVAPTENKIGSEIVREIIIPALTKEINQGQNFAQLRQVYNSLILATWYKNKIKDSILNQVYANRNKIAGVNIDNPQEKQKIYEQYLQAFKKGAYNYIKEEVDSVSQQSVPRKYFSGGVLISPDKAMLITHQEPSIYNQGNWVVVAGQIDQAQLHSKNDAAINIQVLADGQGIDPEIILQQIKEINAKVHSEEFYNFTGKSYDLIMRTIRNESQNLKYALAFNKDKNRIVGYVFFERKGNGTINDISYLAVLPEYQRQEQRIGAMLMQYVVDDARSANIKNLELETPFGNNSAIKFYLNLPKYIKGLSVTKQKAGKIVIFNFTLDLAMKSEVEINFDTVIDLPYDSSKRSELSGIGLALLQLFDRNKPGNALLDTADLWDYLDSADIADRDQFLSVASYLIFGEVLDEYDFIKSLNEMRNNQKTLNYIRNAMMAFGAVYDVAGQAAWKKETFTFREVLARYFTKLSNAKIAMDLISTEHKMRVFSVDVDMDVQFLKRAVRIALDKIPDAAMRSPNTINTVSVRGGGVVLTRAVGRIFPFTLYSDVLYPFGNDEHGFLRPLKTGGGGWEVQDTKFDTLDQMFKIIDRLKALDKERQNKAGKCLARREDLLCA